MRHSIMLIAFILLGTIPACGSKAPGADDSGKPGDWTMNEDRTTNEDKIMNTERKDTNEAERTRPEQRDGATTRDTAVFGAGCFWCVEAVFERLDGVYSVEAGYTGGRTTKPTYEQVCSGQTGHAEVARIVYDPAVISFAELLEVFWQAHDPTTLNRQGADVGTQYRSAIFFTDEQQRHIAEASRAEAQKQFDAPIVTEIAELGVFHPAENYHQDYYNRNRNAPYCQVVIRPKLKKLKLE